MTDFVLLRALSDPGAPDSDLGPFQVIASWLAGWPAGWLHCQTWELRHVYKNGADSSNSTHSETSALRHVYENGADSSLQA